MLAKNVPDKLTKDELRLSVLISLQHGRVGLQDDKVDVERMEQQNRC
jgi:hypothetical protein